jgi:hypothetical protein
MFCTAAATPFVTPARAARARHLPRNAGEENRKSPGGFRGGLFKTQFGN